MNGTGIARRLVSLGRSPNNEVALPVGDREHETETRSALRLVLRPEPSLVRFNDGLRHRQADAHAVEQQWDQVITMLTENFPTAAALMEQARELGRKLARV